MNVGARLHMLAPGEKQVPIPEPTGFHFWLRDCGHGNARMIRRHGILYLAMKHGKRFPADLTACDHDRAAALGWMLEGHPIPWEERYPPSA